MNPSNVLSSLFTHLQISFLGVMMGCLVGIPLASLLKKNALLAKTVMSVVDIIQTIPTLAMLTFLMLFLGLHDRTVIVAIFLYSLFPIVRNTYTGITNVDRGVIKAGKGYITLELPLALPVILSGVRLALIGALGIATTGVLIGSGGLGMLIWRGIQTRNTMMMLSGAIPVSLLAILFDVLLSKLETHQKKTTG